MSESTHKVQRTRTLTDLGKCSIVIAFWDKNGFLWPLGLFQSLNPLCLTFRLACFCNIDTNMSNYINLTIAMYTIFAMIWKHLVHKAREYQWHVFDYDITFSKIYLEFILCCF